MRLDGEKYSERLSTFSNFTIVLISGIGSLSREAFQKIHTITTNSELTEDQVIEKLMELRTAYYKPDVSITHNDALDIVCDALEFGRFYSLFEILDANATLEYVDERRSVCGIKDIIDFIVDESNRLKDISEGDMTLDVLRVVEGERYGIGEKCILLTYFDEQRKPLVIKIHFANHCIKKLEFFSKLGKLRLVTDDE